MKYFLPLIFFSAIACIRSVDPPVRSVAPVLVVEGWITTDSAPYTIKLSYSGVFTSQYQQAGNSFIPDAAVSITDDQGDSTPCAWVADGTYHTTNLNFMGAVGRTYILKIRLASGKTYVSKPEKIAPVRQIDSVSVVYDSTYITDVRPTQLIVSAHTQDSGGIANYYRWTASGYIPRRSSGAPCSIGSPPCGTECVCYAFCAQFLADDQIHVMSDQFIDGKEISQPVFYSPLYWNGTHFIEVKQYSITRTVFEFWQSYLEQTSRTGSILDPLPAPLTGNIYNQADSGDVALGVFSASMVVSKKIRIIPTFLQEYYLRAIAGSYIKEGDCQYVFSNTLPDNESPPGWENAETITVN